MRQERIDDEYFEWLFDLVCDRELSKMVSHRKLLIRLHSTTFRYSIHRDANRASDGVDLRHRFALEQGYQTYHVLTGEPCTVLEMMIALAIRCEETIMDNPNVGNRTSQWFWGMMRNLGLGSITDKDFDRQFVDDIVDRFLDREYEQDGKGGLFTIRNCEYDLRNVEIWYQLCWYLDTII